MIRTLRLPFVPPLNWEALLSFLGPRAIPGIERVQDGLYHRLIPDGRAGSLVSVSLHPGSRHLMMHVHHGCGGGCTLERKELTARAVRLFDLQADPVRIGRHLGRDPLLAPRIRRLPGLRLPGAWDPFETSVRGLLGQQVSVAGATTLAGRLVQRLGRKLSRSRSDELRAAAGLEAGKPGDPVPFSHLFPGPGKIARARLDGIGMPGARVAALQGLSGAFARGEVDLTPFSPESATAGNLEERSRELILLKGIGPWTAHYLAMRVLKHPDAFPAGDLGLIKATGLKAAELERRAEVWRPWRAYAALWLWQGS